jgi:serine/threonine protein phosphatase PrpC
MKSMCPAEDQEAPGEPPEVVAGNGRLASGGASGTVEWAYVSDPGRARDNNEDFAGVFAPDETEAVPLFVVADGMGGHAAGEIASRLAVEAVLGNWTSGGSGPPHQRLRSAVRAANVAVFDAGQDSSRKGMGSTLTALALAGREAAIAHAGDSRAYLVREGQASQLTADHSRVGEMLRMRLLTAEQAAIHPQRSMLTRCLGTEPMVQIDLTRQPAEVGDTYVLCSDGLWDLVGRAEIAAIAGGPEGADTPPPAPSEAAAALIELALKRDAPDNVTVVVIRLVAHGPAPSRRSFWRRGA